MEGKMGLDMYLQGDKYLWTKWNDREAMRKEDGFELERVNLRQPYGGQTMKYLIKALDNYIVLCAVCVGVFVSAFVAEVVWVLGYVQ